MAFKAGDEVYIKDFDTLGTVVKERIAGDGIYLVRMERYVSERNLQLAAEADEELRVSRRPKWQSPEFLAGVERLNQILPADITAGRLSDETMQLMSDVGLVVPIEKQ